MNNYKTELDFTEEYPKDDPTERRGLLTIMVLCLVSGIVGPMLVLLYAEEIDNFLNTLSGAITLVCLFGACGITWLVWRIRKIIEG